jgi:hypothetical protein
MLRAYMKAQLRVGACSVADAGRKKAVQGMIVCRLPDMT